MAGPSGTANSVMAWVVGLIIPILPEALSVNQRLPSGPAVIPIGQELAVGTANSVMAWVVGLIIPILSAPVRLGEPEVAVGARRDAPGRIGRSGMGNSVNAGDARQQATIFQPFEPEPRPGPVGTAAARAAALGPAGSEFGTADGGRGEEPWQHGRGLLRCEWCAGFGLPTGSSPAPGAQAERPEPSGSLRIHAADRDDDRRPLG